MKETDTPKKFVQVFINGDEKNLPEKSGFYIAMRHDGEMHADEYFAGRNSLTRWPDYIDWYLQPIEPESEGQSIQHFMDDIHKWADETFGIERTALAPLHHLKKEVNEAIVAMETKASDETIEELADCFILILNSSSKYRLTFKQLLDCAKWKMEKNKKRKWGKPDENGVCEHIKQITDQPKETADQPQPTKMSKTCECEIPYFPTGNIHFCSKCNKPTIY